MSNLCDLDLDPNVKENDGAGRVIPAGEYKVVIIGDQIKDTKDGKGKQFVPKLQIIEGDYCGVILKDYINIKNPSSACQAIGEGTIKRICRIVGEPYPMTRENSYLYGIPMMVTISIKTIKDTERLSNNVEVYNSVDDTPSQKKSVKLDIPKQMPINNSGNSWPN
ncbi:MAG TPA: DUF669 domain-containing protein [Candidatus Paceibacterota bacterium]|nr:DUF669 domain-containing protein [Candidatus Paceibacterota bacterium]